MVKVGKGKLTHVEVPVGMPGPLHIQRFPVIERQANRTPYNLIDNRPVVNTMHRDETSSVMPKELRHRARLSDPYEFRDVNDRYSELLRGNQEVGQSLLMVRIYLGENDVLGVMTTKYDLRIKLPEAGFGVPTQESVETFVKSEDLAIGLREQGLVSEDGGEGLKFDQT